MEPANEIDFPLMAECISIRQVFTDGGVISAAWEYKRLFPSIEAVPTDEETAKNMLLGFLYGMLETGDFSAAACLLWGRSLFDPRPRFVRLIWEQLPIQSEVIVIGCGAGGKSYGVAVWLLLDWLRDPLNTCVKVISTTREHALRNVFAHIKNLHEHALLPLPGERKAHSIQASKDEKQGIHLVAIPQGETGAGRLQGFHPSPRVEAHPTFGTLTRVRAILDEAEEVPFGIWPDIDNMLITKYDAEHVKIICATNPRDKLSPLGLRCEPEDGWTDDIYENGECWISKLGWCVIRLDGAKCENVVENRNVFPGLLTREGYNRYVLLGTESGEYSTMGRGMFPKHGASWSAIPEDLVSSNLGMFEFVTMPTYCASVDLAFEGGDLAVMTVGKWGRARVNGKIRDALQAESQFDIPKKLKSMEMAEYIMDTCKKLHILPHWLVVDRTGNGTGVHDILTTKFGEAVMGVHYSEAATNKRVMLDDTQVASDLYSGIVTELFFATRKFFEFGYLRIAPSIKKEKLIPQLSGRKYRLGAAQTVRIESKKEYIARGNKSPDYADSLTMLVHLVRMRGDMKPEMVEKSPEREKKARVGYVDALEFKNFED